jgi:lipoic acid synthetase
MRGLDLHTVCEEARCPNVAECWGQGTATFMILGDVCTRSCGFCAVKTGLPQFLDREEPARVAEAVEAMHLRHAVITSVNRDELPDGGALIFAETIEAVRERSPETSIEVLIPDFKGSRDALETILAAKPEILNHNVETVPRLYKKVRPGARYSQSVELLRRSKEIDESVVSKTGIMLGLGESAEEVEALMRDLVAVRVDVFTIGQYLQPTKVHLPVERFVHPDEFREIGELGKALGFRHVESGPLVRSSYHAANQIP